MNVGDKIVLWNRHQTFALVEIKEVRTDVPNMWTGEKNCTGYRAEDQSGNEYTCNWTCYPSDSPTPLIEWWSNDHFWTYLNCMLGTSKVPFRTEILAKYKGHLTYCEKHSSFYDGSGCYICKADEEKPAPVFL